MTVNLLHVALEPIANVYLKFVAEIITLVWETGMFPLRIEHKVYNT